MFDSLLFSLLLSIAGPLSNRRARPSRFIRLRREQKKGEKNVCASENIAGPSAYCYFGILTNDFWEPEISYAHRVQPVIFSHTMLLQKAPCFLACLFRFSRTHARAARFTLMMRFSPRERAPFLARV